MQTYKNGSLFRYLKILWVSRAVLKLLKGKYMSAKTNISSYCDLVNFKRNTTENPESLLRIHPMKKLLRKGQRTPHEMIKESKLLKSAVSTIK